MKNYLLLVAWTLCFAWGQPLVKEPSSLIPQKEESVNRTQWSVSTDYSQNKDEIKVVDNELDIQKTEKSHSIEINKNKMETTSDQTASKPTESVKSKRYAREIKQVQKSPAEIKLYYSNIGKMVSDLAHSLELRVLTVYIDTTNGIGMLKPLFANGGLLWNVKACNHQPQDVLNNNTFADEDEDAEIGRDDQNLIVTLCSRSSVEAILKEMGHNLRYDVWLVASLPNDIEDNWSPDVYIPIDSMIITATGTGEYTFLLQEIWSPAKNHDLRIGHLATWNGTTDFKEEEEETSEEETPRDTVLGFRHLVNEDDGKKEGTLQPPTSAGRKPSRLIFTKSTKYERRKNLSGVHFVITTIKNSRAHYGYYDAAENRTILSGFFGNVWEVLRNQLNFTYTIRTPDDGEFGRFHNGSWTGLISDVMTKKADLIVAFLSRTYERSQVVDYSSVLLKFSYRIFARPDTVGALSWTSYTQPFSFNLWLATAAIYFVLTGSYWYLSYSHKKFSAARLTNGKEGNALCTSKRARDFAKFVKYQQFKNESPLLIWAAFTQQGWTNSPNKSSLRIVFWTAYILGVMLLAAYSATLVSFLTITETNLNFDSLEDLTALGNYRLGIQKGSKLEELFRTPKFSVYWNSLIEPYDNTLVDSYSELRSSALADTKFSYIGSYEVQRLDPIGACTFQSARQHLLFNDGAFAWTKDFPYGPLMDHYINILRETGLLYKMKRIWYPEPYSCPKIPKIALDFKKVISAFVMLSVGAGLSFFILLLEKIYPGSSIKSDRKEEEMSIVQKEEYSLEKKKPYSSDATWPR